MLPRMRNSKNPDMTVSFNAQYGADPRVSAFTTGKLRIATFKKFSGLSDFPFTRIPNHVLDSN